MPNSITYPRGEKNPQMMSSIVFVLLLQCVVTHDGLSEGKPVSVMQREHLDFWDRNGNADSVSCDHKEDRSNGDRPHDRFYRRKVQRGCADTRRSAPPTHDTRQPCENRKLSMMKNIPGTQEENAGNVSILLLHPLQLAQAPRPRPRCRRPKCSALPPDSPPTPTADTTSLSWSRTPPRCRGGGPTALWQAG